jgi:mono/diheme cytochrome c family protein
VFRTSWLVALVWIAGCGSVGSTSTDGKTVFATYCAACHGPQGRPPAEMTARLNVRDLTSPELRARVTPAVVEHQVRTGSANKLMPAFEGAISDAQIKAVSAWVADPAFVPPAPR